MILYYITLQNKKLSYRRDGARRRALQLKHTVYVTVHEYKLLGLPWVRGFPAVWVWGL